jgi:hypothetical protein
MILEMLEKALTSYDPCAGEVLKAEEGGHVGVGRSGAKSALKQNK